MSMPGETKVQRNPESQDSLLTYYNPAVRTLYQSFKHAVDKWGSKKFLGKRDFNVKPSGPYVFETYSQVFEKTEKLASGLQGVGLKDKSNIGFYSINKPEWVVAELACYAINYVPVALYDTLGSEAINFICNQTEMELAFVSAKKISSLLSLSDKIPTLKWIICLDEVYDRKLSELAKEKKINVIFMIDLVKKGESRKLKPVATSQNDLCTINYTSGTTGNPKGVMITHASMMSAMAAALRCFNIPYRKNSKALFELKVGKCSHLSYLPLAHIFEHIVLHVMIAAGGKIGFYQGDLTKILSDLDALRPTIFVTVPRLLNRIYDKVWSGVREKGGLAEFLFARAFNSKMESRVVFGKIRGLLGGRVTGVITGSAALNPDVMSFMMVALSCPVVNGYGMTETCAFSACTSAGGVETGTVGMPSPCAEIKLVDVPNMNYLVTDKPRPRGEICIRGPACFSGYYKDPERTKETLLKDGWVITGDIGELDENGSLRIIDRKKSLLKLAQGEYVSPEKVEGELIKNPLIAQAFVEGNSLESSVVAVVVLDEEVLTKWANGRAISVQDAYQDPVLKAKLLNEIKELSSSEPNVLNGFETPKAIHIEKEMFTPENGLLTSTFKIKREIARTQYSKVLDGLYKDLNKSFAPK